MMISNYTGFQQVLRKRPEMYVGPLSDSRSLCRMIAAVFPFAAIDDRLCSLVSVSLSEDNTTAYIRDNGPKFLTDIHSWYGEPVCQVELSTLHAGCLPSPHPRINIPEYHGVEKSVVNALSEVFEILGGDEEGLWYQRYERGVPLTALEKVGVSSFRGVITKFRIDSQIFGSTVFNRENVSSFLRIVKDTVGPEIDIHFMGYSL